MRRLNTAFHILSNDPALRRPTKTAGQTDEQAAADVAAFEALLANARETGDRSALPIVGSRKPALWKLRGLSLYAVEEVKAEAANTSRMCRLAVQFGLVGMEDAVGTDGEKLACTTERGGGNEAIVTYDVVQEIFGEYEHDAVMELGVRIMEISKPRPRSGQGS